MRPGTWQIVLLLVVVLLLFGANRLPGLARSVGQSLKILKTEVKDLADDDRPAATPADRPDGAAPSATPAPPAEGDPGPKA
ncbi:twin-arginine translocase TatA/TatE family subunit [Actinotalea sp. K2]|uniref:twin-arginine translocase TatA/TatE family subunit n=1 Tax=Actinotalea sp. K2 TaxID=2939438 RepID=UPI002017B0FD|nr:twin-arginine translocase TatA/TatE family subunit [Actinotalea sp. K2]MCL3862801.1 twin-arginine translocase TatA/TatE family subunit [Actinotalea sp. K2]